MWDRKHDLSRGWSALALVVFATCETRGVLPAPILFGAREHLHLCSSKGLGLAQLDEVAGDGALSGDHRASGVAVLGIPPGHATEYPFINRPKP